MEYINAIEKDMISARCEDAMKEQVTAIPKGPEYHANRYDTDTSHKIHIWDNEGNSYDIEVSK